MSDVFLDSVFLPGDLIVLNPDHIFSSWTNDRTGRVLIATKHVSTAESSGPWRESEERALVVLESHRASTYFGDHVVCLLGSERVENFYAAFITWCRTQRVVHIPIRLRSVMTGPTNNLAERTGDLENPSSS